MKVVNFFTRTIASVLILFCGTASAQTPVEPNVVIVLADDMNWRDSSAYFDMPGGIPSADMPVSTTPNMKTLADQGLRVNFCFSASSMCAPLRQQLYTGIYPVRSGAHSNHSNIKLGLPSLPVLLEDKGYRVGIMGKQHFNIAEQIPFENVKDDGAVSPSDTEDLLNITAAEDFIARDSTQPYCLVITSNNPHSPHTHGDLVADDSTLPVPPDYVDTPEYRERYNMMLGEVKAFDDEVGHWMDVIANGPNPDNTILIVLTEQGSGFPGGKWTCYDLGQRSGCIVRWPAVVTPATTTNAMVEYVDIVPTILEAVAEARGETNFMPTGLDRLDGRSFLGVIKGENTAHKKYVYGVQTTKDVSGAPDVGYACRSIRSTRYKLIWNLQYYEVFTPGTSEPFKSWELKAVDPNVTQAERDHAQLIVDRQINRPEYQFFDLEADPYELSNLYEDPQHTDEIEHLRTLLERFMASQHDKGIASEQIVNRSSWPEYDEVHPYTAWTAIYPFVFLAESAPTSDPDSDGRDNLSEWVDNTDPFVADFATNSPVIAVESLASSRQVSLQFRRPTHHDSFAISYEVQFSDTLASGDWATVPASDSSPAFQMDDGYLELASLVISEATPVPDSRFYRVVTTALPNNPTQPESFLPESLLSGSGPTASLGDLSATLNKRDFTVTLDTVLPENPVPDRAYALVDLGGGAGVSLTLVGDGLALTASNSGTKADGQVWYLMKLDSADFGKAIQIRMIIDNEESPKSWQDPRGTIFELSYRVQGGSDGRNGATLVLGEVGYVGSNGCKIGATSTSITGIAGIPFGPLSLLSGGMSDVYTWPSTVTYEIVEGQMGHFSRKNIESEVISLP